MKQSNLERLTETDHRCLAMNETDLVGLPSSEELRIALRTTLEELGNNQRYSNIAALITKALEDDDNQLQNLRPLGYALQLVAESQKGCSEVVHFQDTVRFLLAKNGYGLVQTKTYKYEGRVLGVYDFFTDPSHQKVVAISQNDISITTGILKDKYRLDDYIDDFLNYRAGSRRDVDGFSGMGCLMYLVGFPASIGIFAYGMDFASGMDNLNLGIGISVLASVTVAGTAMIGGEFLSKRKLKKQLENIDFPMKSISSGIYGLIDAFPLIENHVSKK